MRKGVFRGLTIAGFVLIFLYSLSLCFMSEPILVHDARGYVDLAHIINQQGWQEYFRTGPNREPFYPFLIAQALKIGGKEGYVAVLKFAQWGMLLLCGVLLYLLMKYAHVPRRLKILILGYGAMSPALLNSAFSVYSEVACYDFLLIFLICSAWAWNMCLLASKNRILILGISWGIVGLGVLSLKGVYEFLVPFMLLPFCWLAARSLIRREKAVGQTAILFILAGFLVFESGLNAYKALNWKYNGVFAFTDRGSWALYGNTARRQAPMTWEKYQAGLMYNLLDMTACSAILGAGPCSYWDLPVSDRLAAEKNYEVIKNFSATQRNHELLRQTAEKIWERPWQFFAVYGFDWVHMFFWENTHIGFVAYPDFLERVYNDPWVDHGLRFVMGLLSLCAMMGIFFCVYYHRPCAYLKTQSMLAPWPIYFFAVLIVLAHVSVYALFSTLPRYALPIAPIFLLLIAGWLGRLFCPGVRMSHD